MSKTMPVTILGIDPGFASLGLAIVQVWPSGGPRPLVERVEVVRTEKATKKRAILSSDDNVQRGRKLAREFAGWVSIAHVIGAESMSFSRNASASHKIGIAWGVIVAVADSRGVPICQTSPQDVKLRIAGAKTADKAAVQMAVTDATDFSRDARTYLADLALGQHEHAYDAIACALSVVDGDLVRGLLRM